MSSSPCDTCAFAPKGTPGAASEAHNRLKGLICVFGAHVFWCHHGRDGEEYDRNSPLGPFQLAPANRKPCAGWQAKTAELKRRGYFVGKDFLFIRQLIGRQAMRALDVFANKSTPKPEKDAAKKVLDESCRFVFAKDISDLEIPL